MTHTHTHTRFNWLMFGKSNHSEWLIERQENNTFTALIYFCERSDRYHAISGLNVWYSLYVSCGAVAKSRWNWKLQSINSIENNKFMSIERIQGNYSARWELNQVAVQSNNLPTNGKSIYFITRIISWTICWKHFFFVAFFLFSVLMQFTICVEFGFCASLWFFCTLEL